MNNIESVFVEYSSLITEFGESKLVSRYETLLDIIADFKLKMDYGDNVYVNEIILLYAMCDYFSDISRLKLFHKIDRINEVKIASYEIYWLLKRKPLQVKADNKELAYVNEQFALSRIIHYLSNNEEKSLRTLNNDELDFFVNTLFYYLKYRPLDAQALEMFLISFNAGIIFAQKQ
jgi:hypothetical protein